ncbi:hypothetical protein [Frankia sp. ACN1ag]|uniref:hypothetical protein n=1 Tax=Frankia sp. ACN1ag TaxID=102891 RepID=UPI000ABD06DD|nr:hypothetical protein [Frankia sp. ACN1ag]
MPKNHARKNALAAIKDTYSVDHTTAIAILDDPANQLLCEDCGWTVGMVCPECPKGCGCETRCTGWRHDEYRESDGEPDEYECDCGYHGAEDHCCECGAAPAEYHCAC